ncbi:head-tail adaptor protein [Streptomyces sp. NPDC000851]
MSRVSHLLNTSLQVWRFTRTPDGMGGYSEAWSQVATVRARLSQPTSRERVLADAHQARLTHIAYLPSSADVRRSDELRLGTRVLEVLATFEPSAPGTYLRADCEERQPTQ